ncbi:MAG: ArsA-related P-loop ATPase, partial [Myxococcota bacterium]|nr:ArsA-related P-loop ATPase [Myxococcota bacterium]
GAALAVALARRGRRTLVAMVNARDRLSGMLEVPRIGRGNVAVGPGIDAVNLHPEAALEEFGIMTLRSRLLYRLVFENRLVRPFLSGVPGLGAWAMLGKATYHALQTDRHARPRYDTVILDCPATGHAVAMLALPRTISRILRAGPLARDAEERAALLADPERTVALPVSRLEEMIVNETAELVARLRADAAMRADAMVVNCVSPVRFDAEELDRLDRPGSDPDAAAIADAARAAVRRADREDAQRRRLERLVPLPSVELPLLDAGRIRMQELQRLADLLEPLL